MKNKRILCLVLLVLSMLSVNPDRMAIAAGAGAESHGKEDIHLLVEGMSPEQRVGQLFLVTFSGSTAEEDSRIFKLINDHYIGGVVLQAENDNFIEGENTLTAAYDLIYQIQTTEWKASQVPFIDPVSGEASTNAYIPLFIGISQPGGGGPGDQILAGLTPLPNEMAIGATWDTDLAEQVGEVIGYELGQIGFNLFFGPSLDVLDSPDATLGNGLGAGVFGGDPFWVGQMGQAYISGLHTGSEGKMLVAARNFPGRGSSDRPTGEEPATVRKPLEYLKQIELAPFFSVTGNAPSQLSAADALLVSHIRYQGFQGNIRATTRPVSFDAQALTLILALPEFATWNEAGGLLISDDLGSETVRRFYDPSDTSFQARLVARDAFLAGNDLLYLGNIQSSDIPDNYETVLNILAFFSQKYREDPAFAQRVDLAVERILSAKLKLYGEFQLSDVVPQRTGLEQIGLLEEITFEVASKAATLVSPASLDLESLIPESPAPGEDIIFITDTRPVKQCSTCTPVPMLNVEDMQEAVLRLYGPQAGGEISASQIKSITLEAIASILEGGSGDMGLESQVDGSQWIVINMLDSEPGEDQTVILKRFLSERQDLLRDKYVILFAFDAPFYLDSTDISKLTAYYCLFSKTAPFIEVAARILFKEVSPEGALPVSVSSVGYDLFTALTPDPEQIITLSLDIPPLPISTDEITPEVTPTLGFRVGDSVIVKTGILIDRNGNPVPDGTEVHFMLSMKDNPALLESVDAVTLQGVARASFQIDTPGLLEIRATSDPATISVTLQLEVSGEGLIVTVLAPTPEIGVTSTPDTSSPLITEEITPIERGRPGFTGWLLMTILLLGTSALVFTTSRKIVAIQWRFRLALCTAGGGLIGFTYLALGLPGVKTFLQEFKFPGIIGVVLLGAIVGFLAGYVWEGVEAKVEHSKKRKK